MLADALEVATFSQGQAVYAQGESADSFYLVATGTATATRAGGESSSLQMGGYFGERALHDSEPRCGVVWGLGPAASGLPRRGTVC